MNSTDLKFRGEGECKRNKHQPKYHRQWRKLYIEIDVAAPQIRALLLSTNNVSDSQVLEDLLHKFHWN